MRTSSLSGAVSLKTITGPQPAEYDGDEWQAASQPRYAALSFSATTLAAFAMGAAVTLSTIVFSEPAVADALMLCATALLPILGVVKFGKASVLNFAMWFALVALGVAGTALSTTFDTAIKHQLVTLFLAAGAFVVAGYVSADPIPRSRMILQCYVAAALIATAAAVIGYFRIIPQAYDLFTNFDRARGTFKDPNVYGAALAPAIVAAVWVMLRETPRRAMIAAGIALPLIVGLLISFSRGAWLSAGLSIAIVVCVALLRSRRKTDFRRFGGVGAAGVIALLLGVGIATQFEQVRGLLEQRANLDQSYDQGPDGRFGGQQKARALILEHPFGIGTHTFRDTYHHEEPHNVYLSMFLNAGWLGGMLYIVSVAMTLCIGHRAAVRNSRLQGPALVAFAAFAGLAFEGFVIDSDHWRHMFIMMGLIWGIADSIPLETSSERREGDAA